MPEFQAAATALSRAEDGPAGMTRTLLDFLPVSGASLSTVGDLHGTETLAASDEVITMIDELQFDLGEGPCWDAIASRKPVLEPDVRGCPRHSWPAFSRALADQNVAAIFAFPLAVGPLRVGAIDLYSNEPAQLTEDRTVETSALASIIGRQVLRDALRSAGSDGPRTGGPHSRRTVHQATGFVIAQCGVSVEDAHLLLQGHAFAEGVTMEEIAREVVEGGLVFTATGTVLGDSQ